MGKQLRILQGLHAGAETSLESAGSYVIGADASCSVVLCDTNVAERHCAITHDAFGMSCRAVEADVAIDGQPLLSGEVRSLKDFQIVACGPVLFSVGPAEGDWSAVDRAAREHRASFDPVRSLKRLNPYALFASVLVGMMGLIGLAYAALSNDSENLAASRVEAARKWLLHVAPAGSELQIGLESPHAQGLVLSGYVAQSTQLKRLASASLRSGFEPRMAVYAVDEMMSDLSRISRQIGIPCEGRYRGGGQVVCANQIDTEANAARLKLMARDVPGLMVLEAELAPQAARVALAPVSVAETAPPVISQKFSVLISSKGRYLVNVYGKKYSEGEEFQGLTIKHISIDRVLFEREGRDFEFYVAALGARR